MATSGSGLVGEAIYTHHPASGRHSQLTGVSLARFFQPIISTHWLSQGPILYSPMLVVSPYRQHHKAHRLTTGVGPVPIRAWPRHQDNLTPCCLSVSFIAAFDVLVEGGGRVEWAQWWPPPLHPILRMVPCGLTQRFSICASKIASADLHRTIAGPTHLLEGRGRMFPSLKDLPMPAHKTGHP